jgi:carboxymethylenebutenolidase
VELVREEVAAPVGYLTRPARADGPPAVLVIQELWGLDSHIRDVADRLATAGYLAFAPDLYAPRPPALAPERTRAVETFYEETPADVWADEERLAAARDARPDGAELAETFAVLSGLDRSAFLPALEGHLAWLREQAPRVGTIGFCMGGGLSAALTTTSSPPDAAVVFYGGLPEPRAHERVAAPILGFFGGDDPRLTQWVEPFGESMRALGKEFEGHVYEGAPHAFFNDTRTFYRSEAARQAWARTLTFFAERL